MAKWRWRRLGERAFFVVKKTTNLSKTWGCFGQICLSLRRSFLISTKKNTKILQINVIWHSFSQGHSGPSSPPPPFALGKKQTWSQAATPGCVVCSRDKDQGWALKKNVTREPRYTQEMGIIQLSNSTCIANGKKPGRQNVEVKCNADRFCLKKSKSNDMWYDINII